MERKGVEHDDPSHFSPPFHFLKRTPPSAERSTVGARLSRLVALMFKMAPVTNYRTEFPGASATLAAEFFPALLPAAAVAVPKGPTSSGFRTLLSFSINVTLPALVVRYGWTEVGRGEESIRWSVLNPPSPTPTKTPESVS